MDVAQVTGKNHHASSSPSSAALPTQQDPAGKGVTQIMEADMAPSVGGDHVLRQLTKHSVDHAVAQLPPSVRDKECLGLRERTSPLPGIATQWGQSRRVQRHHSRMLKLAEPNSQNALGKVDVLDRERQGLRDAQPGASQQSQQRPIGQRSELAGQSAAALEQLLELSGGKQVRCLAAKSRSQGMSGRDLDCWLKHGLVTGEDPDNIQTP